MSERREILRTQRLRLTTWLPSDLDDLYELHSDAETMRWVGRGRPETRAEVEARLTAYRAEQDGRGWTKWRVDNGGHYVGRAGFGEHEIGRELGYTLRRATWGRGYATELARALLDWHVAHPMPGGPPQVYAYAALENLASRRVLEKIGFAFVKVRDHNGMPCAFYEWAPPGLSTPAG